MDEENMPEAVYRELLEDTMETIKAVRKQMESEDVDAQVFAVDAFIKLSEMAAALAEDLVERPERDRNPLSRRFRGEGVYNKLTEENHRIKKWLEKFSYFLRNVPSTVTPRSRRLREEEKYMLETQMIRQEIVRSLKELYELALRYAKSRRVKVEEKQKWARLAAFIAQTINTIIDSYDEVMIEQTLDELEQYVKIHIEED